MALKSRRKLQIVRKYICSDVFKRVYIDNKWFHDKPNSGLCNWF